MGAYPPILVRPFILDFGRAKIAAKKERDYLKEVEERLKRISLKEEVSQ